jgi:hypothetical protein
MPQLSRTEVCRRVALHHRALRDMVAAGPVNDPAAVPPPGGMDPQVRAHLISDLNWLADRYDGPESE